MKYLTFGLAVFIVAAVCVSFFGLWLAFKASVIIGFLALAFEPSPLIFGVAMLFFNVNIPQAIAKALGWN